MSQPSTDIRLISPEERTLWRRRMDRDPWYFSKYVCQRDPKAERHHRPLLYLFTRRAALLCACLDNPKYDGTITQQVRADFTKGGINWSDPADLWKVERRLRRINFRGPRSGGKSTFADDADLWDVSIDPNMTISIGSKSDPYAWKRIDAIGEYVKSAEYAFWYPERVPDDVRLHVMRDAIYLKGRTRIVPEATIEGRGINSQWTGNHYRKNRRDDIVGTESGEASVGDALRHEANMDALHDETGWAQDIFIGTVNGPMDDHAILSKKAHVLTIVMPIEEHAGGTTLENVYTDGNLTMPEWFDRERVNEIKENARENPLGPIWLLQNYYMAAADAGVMLFTRQIVAKSHYMWGYDAKVKRNVILRPKKGKEKTCRDRNDPRFNLADWFVLDLQLLPLSAFAWAADQSVSQTGDEWAFAYGCIDWEGVIYVMDSVADHGYMTMVDRTPEYDKTPEICAGKTRKRARSAFGLDTNATQGMTLEWMARTPEFRSLAHRAKKISGNERSKDEQIRRWLLARMTTGDLYVDPSLAAWDNECLRYQPRNPDGTLKRNPIDNRLDAGWMMCSLLRRPPSPEQMDEDSVYARVEQERYERTTSVLTGVNTDNWMGSMWSARN